MRLIVFHAQWNRDATTAEFFDHGKFRTDDIAVRERRHSVYKIPQRPLAVY